MIPTAIFGMNGLMNPEALLLLLAVPVILAAEWFARAPGALSVSTGEAAAATRNACSHGRPVRTLAIPRTSTQGSRINRARPYWKNATS